MSQTTIILLALLPLLLLELFVIFVVVPQWAAGMVRPMAERFPPREPALHARWRSCQSFGIGMLNLGLSVNVAADESYLHLRPALLGRWLRFPAMSIPWNEIDVPARGRARIAGQSVAMPRWCRDLASRQGIAAAQ